MPSGKVDLPRIEDNRDGTVRIQYDPREEGIHELVVLHNGTPIQGTVYLCVYFTSTRRSEMRLRRDYRVCMCAWVYFHMLFFSSCQFRIGSPYKFHVDSISSGSVTAYGAGLETGKTGEPCLFTISTKGAGAGGLSLSVEGPSKANVCETCGRFISLNLFEADTIFHV